MCVCVCMCVQKNVYCIHIKRDNNHYDIMTSRV